MNSEWFILKKNEHLGPFSKKQILEMVDERKIEGPVQIWREGWSQAKSLDMAFKNEPNYSDSDIPPPLPPLFPAKAPVKNPVKGVTKKKAKLKTSGITKKKNIQNKLKNKMNLSIAFVLLVILTVIFFVLLPEFSSPQIFSRPALMDISSHRRLSLVAKSEGALVAESSLSNDKKTLWLAINSPLQGKVSVNLKSLADKTLEGHSHVQAIGHLKDRLIEFSQLQFIYGTRLVEGIYQVEIRSIDTMELSWWSRFTGKKANHLQYSGQVLISSQSKKNFEKQLAKILKRKKSNSQQFWEELIQKYQTVMMISDQIKDAFLKVFQSPVEQWPIKTKEFETEYASKYGIFFTEFVKANEASYQKISAKKFENVNDVLANYNQLSNLATEIGEHSMFILENLQKFKGEDHDGVELQKANLEKLESIIQRCKDKLQLLTESLN